MASSATFTTSSIPSSTPRAATPAPQPRQGLFARLMQNLAKSRQRQADDAVARLIAHHGGKITDSVERQIERQFMRF